MIVPEFVNRVSPDSERGHEALFDVKLSPSFYRDSRFPRVRRPIDCPFSLSHSPFPPIQPNMNVAGVRETRDEE